MNITEFLEARIAEDEAAAKLGGWHNGGGTFANDNYGCLLIQPARVLAECAAKRAIIGLHHPDRQLENWYWSMRKCAECGGTWHGWLNNDVPTNVGPEQGCRTLREMAAVYADHPDYDPAWVPEK